MSTSTSSPPGSLVADDLAYILPMATFLLIIGAVGYLGNDYWWQGYLARVLIVGTMLALFWRRYTRIRWDYWWLGAIVGVVGIFQWVGMQSFLQQWAFFKPDATAAFNPEAVFGENTWQFWSFVALRWVLGATLLVPLMEELFWRDFAWRTVIAPNNFKLAKVGEWDWKAFLGVAGAFALVHGNWWLTSIVWALMIGGLLATTRSLGACIVAHAVTNFLLGAYVLYTKDWTWW